MNLDLVMKIYFKLLLLIKVNSLINGIIGSCKYKLQESDTFVTITKNLQTCGNNLKLEC